MVDDSFSPTNNLLMRPLSEQEAKVFFAKLVKYIGTNVKRMIERQDQAYCFRLSRNQVFYVSEMIAKRAQSVEKKSLVSFGTCMGHFTKGMKFKLAVTALDYLAHYAQYKIWVKASAELGFLHGGNIIKSGISRISENTPDSAGIVVFSEKNFALGFGVTVRSVEAAKRAGPTDLIVVNQADLGEYLRHEETLL